MWLLSNGQLPIEKSADSKCMASWSGFSRLAITALVTYLRKALNDFGSRESMTIIREIMRVKLLE